MNNEQGNKDFRIWLYLANRPFTTSEKSSIEKELEEFTKNWKTHGHNLLSSFQILYNQIIKIMVNEENLLASGCSIDSSVHFINHIEAKYKLSLTDHGRVAIISDGRLLAFPFHQVKNKIENGAIVFTTPVFDLSLTSEYDWQIKGLLPAEKSWIKRYLINKVVKE